MRLDERQKKAAADFVVSFAKFRAVLVAQKVVGSDEKILQHAQIQQLVPTLSLSSTLDKAKKGNIKQETLQAGLHAWQQLLLNGDGNFPKASTISQEIWKAVLGIPPVYEAAKEMLAAVNTALATFRGDQIDARPPAREGVATIKGHGWSQINEADFETPPDAEREVREFLRGNQWPPMWTAKHGSVWRGAEVANVIDLLNNYPFVIIDGPLGHGKSTLARQVVSEWVAKGRPAFKIGTEGLNDEKLITACPAEKRALLLLDDILLNKKLPQWLEWVTGPATSVLQTVQSRHVEDQIRYVNLLNVSGRHNCYRIPDVKDAEPYVDKILKYNAATSTDRTEVSKRFSEALKRNNFSGGLWSAIWESTRGDKIDRRVGELTGEFFRSERKAESYAVTAVTFLNSAIDFSSGPRSKLPGHSRLNLQPHRSTLLRLIGNLPGLDDEIKEQSQSELHRLGKILKGEFVRSRVSGDSIDDEADPVIEFRSSSVTQAFNRWIFGALGRGGAAMRLPRWPWFLALARALDDDKVACQNYVGVLRLLADSWDLDPYIRKRADHGRSQTDLDDLAKKIFDIAVSKGPVFEVECRLNCLLGKSYELAALEDRYNDCLKSRLKQLSHERFLAATVDSAPVDVLFSVAGSLASSGDILETSTGKVNWQNMINRILESNAPPETKSLAKFFMFRTFCLHDQSVSHHELMKCLDDRTLQRLRKQPNFVTIIRGYLDIIHKPHNKAFAAEFYEGLPLGEPMTSICGLGNMCGLHALVTEVLGKNRAFLTGLESSIHELGAAPHKTSDPMINGLAAIVRNAFRSVEPFRSVFGAEAEQILRATHEAVKKNDFGLIPQWLSKSANILQRPHFS